jgi:hypothetical protein
VLDGDDVADEERVVAGVVLGARARLEPADGAVDERRDRSFARRDAVPVDDRRAARREALRQLALVAAEEADRPRARTAEELVARRLLADRDADERRVERELDERRHGDAHAVALVVDGEHGHAVRPVPHESAQLFGSDHAVDLMEKRRGWDSNPRGR